MRLTITKRLVPVIAAAMIGVALMAGAGQFMSDKIYNSTNFANRNVIPSLLLLDEMRKNYLLARSTAYNLLFNSSDANQAQLVSQINEHRHRVEDALAKFEFNGCFEVSCIADATDKNLLLQEKSLLAEFNVDIAEAIAEARKGNLVRAQGIYLDTADLSEKLQASFDEHFKYNVVLGKRSAEQATTDKGEAFYLLLIIGVTTIFVIGSIGYLSTRSILRQLGGEPEVASEIATKLALGDLSSHITVNSDDQTSLMAKIRQLSETMEKVADRADRISRGNLSDEMALLSDQDRLGQAINHMVVALRTARNLDDRRNWLNHGSNQLSQALNGDYSTQQIAEIAVRTAGHYLGAGRGVFYMPDRSAPMLNLVASFMYADPTDYRKIFRFGEGAIGQVAVEHTPIILAGEKSPAAMIVTGTTSSVPAATYTYPVCKDRILLGVIEFSSHEPFSEIKLDYLALAVEIIGSFIFVAEQRDQIHTLLQQAEQAERDVRKQNEFLQEINSRMEEQQQQLQQQSEELQQTNAQMEEQHQLLEHNNELLRQSETEINEKANQLELSNQYKSEFLANMSHELRTPLNAIILLSKMLVENLDGNLNEQQIKRAEVIHHSGHDLLAIINEVLDLSKVDAGHMEVNVAEVSTTILCAELKDLFESIAQSHGIAFHIDDQLAGKFTSDHAKISQILRNLLSNAFKFTKQGSVTLSVKKTVDPQLPIQITVADTGIGIPKNKHKTIFDAFRQVDGSISREYGGTGLGLTISLRFAELLGGQIHLNSTEGVGSEFTLCLPVTTPALPSPSNKALTIEPRTSERPPISLVDDRNSIQPNDKIILLIDDDATFCSAVVEINHQLGYKTVVARNASEGLQLAASYKPAGILLDLGLPDRSGTDVLHEIKSDPALASTPVYIISGRDHQSTLSREDIIGYLQKPIVSSQIAAAEAALLDAVNKTPTNAVLIIANSTDNEITRILDSGSHPHKMQHVTPATFEPQQLLRHGWGVIIIDLTDLSTAQGLELAHKIRQHNETVALLFFGGHDFSDDEEASLRTYTDSIIINAPQAGVRLQENIAHFLQNTARPDPVQPDHQVRADKSGNLTGKNILVIDDDPRNLFVITAALETNHATVYNALNGRRALDMLESTQVDLIITDIMMPEMDGYQTIAAIRSNPKISSIPIIALTAKAMPEDKKNILETGADDYLSKPVDYDVLCNMAALWSSRAH